MAELNISSATTTNFTNNIPDYILSAKALDAANGTGDEVYQYYEYAPKCFGYLKQVPSMWNALNKLSIWAFSRGWTTQNVLTEIELEHVKGNGKESFTKVIKNHNTIKKAVGDAFTEIKRKEGKLINMINISPERVRTVFFKNGWIKRYDVWNGSEWRAIPKENMLHSMNNKIGDEMHGTSEILVAEADAKKILQALDDEAAIKHRDKAIGIAYYETDKASKITYANSQIEKAVKNGEMLGLPKDTVEILPWPARSSEDRTTWISFLENRFFANLGVPRSIASSDGTSEVGGKMGHVIFEPVYTAEQVDIEEDLWNQHAIKVKFNRPPSLGGLEPSSPSSDMAKNTGDINFQPNDATVNLNRE